MFEFKVEIEYNGHTLGVEGTAEHFTPARPASFNDPGAPADGGQVHITDICILRFTRKRGERTHQLSKPHVAQLGNDEQFCEKVSAAVVENYGRE